MFAGDCGMLHPGLTEWTTRAEAVEVASGDFDAHLSCNRTCEIGMSLATGADYRHIHKLLREATRPARRPGAAMGWPEGGAVSVSTRGYSCYVTDLPSDANVSRLPSSPAEQTAYDAMLRHGGSFGASYHNIWEESDSITKSVLAQMTPRVQQSALALPVVANADAKKWFWIAWADGLLFLALFVIGVVANNNESNSGAWSSILAAPVALAWPFFMALWRTALGAQRQEQRQWLTQVGSVAALVKIYERQEAARSYDPDIERGSAQFISGGPAPLPQPYGVSHEGAEALVAEWVRYLGEADAEVTRLVGDGGIDVQSQHYIAQVKNYSGSVGVAEVRELGGVGAVDGRKSLFFTSGSYAAGAVDFAERFGIALFVYDAQMGTLVGINSSAERALVRGL